jgi:hypothetical protein
MTEWLHLLKAKVSENLPLFVSPLAKRQSMKNKHRGIP